jgi:hypothetical protein
MSYVEGGQISYSGSLADLCSCCNELKTTFTTFSWGGTLDQLQSAADDGCIRCSFLAKCFACFASDIFQKEKKVRFMVWDNFSHCDLQVPVLSDMFNYFPLEVFALHGK